MFGSDVLEVGIGITLLFLFVSLICSALREAGETLLKSRAMDLERGIRELLNDKSGHDYTRDLYDHPLVYSLFAGDYDPGKLKETRALPGGAGGKAMPVGARANLPTYIPSRNFAGALIDLIRRRGDQAAPLSVASLKASAETLPDGRMKRAVLAALDDAQDDMARARNNLEAWFDAAMDRVSGWYKRRTQMILLAIGFGTAALFNIDAVNVARHLSTDKAYRQAVVAQAEAFARSEARAPEVASKLPTGTIVEAKESAGSSGRSQTSTGVSVTPTTDLAAETSLKQVERMRAQLNAGGFSLGWPLPQMKGCDGASCLGSGLLMILGWIVTALAVSLGAPFWFDILNKFMVVRSTVKPAEKSGQEASKDSTASADDGAAKATPVVFMMSPPAGKRPAVKPLA